MTTADPIQAGAARQTPRDFLHRLGDGYVWIAGRQVLACSVVLLACLALRIALLPWMHVPKPSAHDEFSYLLASDTYAHGRLTNPPHPFWQHFETFHVIQQPTYASKYPPLPGLVLAFGQVLFGEPWIGVLLSTALMCAALCWMLQGWISPVAAFTGGLLIVLRVGVFDYWMNGYFGGPVAAIGGALVFGAIGRVLFRGRMAHGATLGAGLAILLCSRPYDFAIVTALAAGSILWALWRKKLDARSFLRIVLVAGVILALAGAFMAYNNYRVTGNPLLLPYQLHDQQYSVMSVFLWSTPRAEPVYHHEILRKFWAGWFVETTRAAQRDPVGSFFSKLSQIYGFFFGFWPLLIPPLIWPYRLRSPEERWNAALLGVALIALVAPLAGLMPHYVASIAGLIYLRFLQTLVRLWDWKPRGRPIGCAIATGCLTLFVYHFAASVADLRTGEEVPRHALAREAIIRQLDGQPGRKLVLVRYSPNHYIHEDWINNLANIDAQPIVWAREMGPAEDRPLIDYYRDRSVWLLEPDQSPASLVPYRVESAAR